MERGKTHFNGRAFIGVRGLRSMSLVRFTHLEQVRAVTLSRYPGASGVLLEHFTKCVSQYRSASGLLYELQLKATDLPHTQ